MTQTWPAALPPPLDNGSGYRPGSVATPAAGPVPARRSRLLADFRRVRLRFLLTPRELEEFQRWYEDDLGTGVESVELPNSWFGRRLRVRLGPRIVITPNGGTSFVEVEGEVV